MKVLRNPFLLSGYISADYFCDREQELIQLNDHLLNERNIVLFSWRRLGKSALIKRFLKESETKGKVEAIYIDLMATTNMAKALAVLIEGVYQRYGKTKSGLSTTFQQLIGSLGLSMKFDPYSGMPSFSLNLHSNFSPNDSLQSIGAFLSARKKTVVIAIDEFQQISRYKNENAEAVFRQFMQDYPQIRFIFSGSHRQMMTTMFQESNRPFYKSSQLMSLAPIPLEKYRTFIKAHFSESNKKISDELITAIYEWCRGQTYAIQLICNRFYGSNIRLNEEGLHQIQTEILEQESPLFGNYFNLLTDAQWKVISAIASEEKVSNPLAQEFSNKYQLAANSTISSALKALQEKELVVRENGEYFVHDVIFSRWLAQKI